MKLTNSIESRKWAVWGALSMAFFIVFFHRYSTAVVADDLIKTLALSSKQLSALASMYFYSYAIMQIPSGILADYLGPRKTSTIGMLLAAVGSIAFGLSQTFFMASMARLLVGIGVSVVFISTLKTQAVWFRTREFATISGLTSFIGNLGGVSATAPLAFLVVALGWRNTFLLVGVVSFLVAIIVYCVVRDTPEEIGLTSYNSIPLAKGIKLSLGLGLVLKNKQTWPVTVLLTTIMGGLMSVSGLWGVLYLMHSFGLNKNTAATYLLAMTLGVMIGSTLWGFIADKLGRKKVLLVLGSSVYTLLWAYLVFGSPSLAMHYPLFFFIGFFSIVFILSFAIVKEANNPALSGIAMSVVNTGGFLGAALLNVIIARILEANWQGTYANGVKVYSLANYQSAFLIILIAGLIGIAASLVIKDK
ncbi:MAG: MFS transporter [bacterium]|nr:MFS transporter [bacterium]